MHLSCCNIRKLYYQIISKKLFKTYLFKKSMLKHKFTIYHSTIPFPQMSPKTKENINCGMVQYTFIFV